MRPLFSLKDLAPVTPPEAEYEGFDGLPATRSRGGTMYRVSMKGRDLSGIVGELQRNTTLHVVSAGQWSLHDMVRHVLHVIGPARVWLSTWSVTEEPARQLIEMKVQGTILDMDLLLDHRTKGQCPAAHQLLDANVARIRLAHCHAKCVVLKNAQWSVSISTTANLTINPRIEKYVISTHPEDAEHDIRWIELFSDEGQPFEDE